LPALPLSFEDLPFKAEETFSLMDFLFSFEENPRAHFEEQNLPVPYVPAWVDSQYSQFMLYNYCE